MSALQVTVGRPFLDRSVVRYGTDLLGWITMVRPGAWQADGYVPDSEDAVDLGLHRLRRDAVSAVVEAARL